MKVEWKPISWMKEYEVSSCGQVRSLKFGKIKILSPLKIQQYLKISFSDKANGVKQYFIHRLVCEAFLGPSHLEVNHKDGNPHNNQLSNLEYVTRSQNELHKRAGKWGVSKLRHWYRARIWVEGKEIHLGCFNTREEAQSARDTEARKRGLYVQA